MDGAFRWSVPALVRARLEVAAAGHLPLVTEELLLEPGGTHDSGVHRLQRARRLMGRVVDDADDVPVVGATVRALGQGSGPARTDADGRFELPCEISTTNPGRSSFSTPRP